MKLLTLVACSAKKASAPCAAKDLYQGQLFRFSRALAEASGAPWRILSAEHGLLDPEAVIAPYDKTLVKMPAAEKMRWTREVLGALFKLLDPARGLSANGAHVLFLAGATYWGPLAWRLEDNGADVDTPLDGMRIGEQLAWLKRQLAEARP